MRNCGARNACPPPLEHHTDLPPLRRAISREELAALPIQRYEGEIQVVATAEELGLAMADIRQERVLGLDTETRPAFRKGEDYLPSLVQVATARRVYLLQLSRVDCAQALAEFLAAPGVVKAGVALAGDLSQLKRMFPLQPESVVDLGRVAKRHGAPQTGLRNLAALLLGIRIPKGARTSNWSAPRLTPALIVYAATDAWISRELYLAFERLGLVGG
jgi:ribonuclease D